MAQAQNIFEAYAATSKSAFDYWISFFPTAPLFGVDWRYGEIALNASNIIKAAEPIVEASAEIIDITTQKAAQTAEVATKHVATTVVDVEKAEPAPDVDDEQQVLDMPELFDTAPAEIDALTDIKGVGPGLEKQLHALGIFTFAQLADLNDAQLNWLDENLNTVKGRCIRDDWSGQAKALIA